MKTALLGLLMLLGANTVYAACDELHNHQFTTLQGDKFNLCDYQDKPILIVNTASKCGFTPQFEKLESLYSRHKGKGLLVIGFPSNDFHQEPGGNKEIGEFCKKTYSVQFPMMAKTSVVGPSSTPCTSNWPQPRTNRRCGISINTCCCPMAVSLPLAVMWTRSLR